MSVATTPYQQNDYQAVSSYRPYELPMNDIAKAVIAQGEFWKKGAQKVKQAYETALNLKLSLEPNIQLRDEFIKNADKELTKLSTMNLADPAVQRQGLNIYKPLFEDEGIVSDDAATRHIEKVNNDALSYRSKDNGKYYSSVNHKYALDGAEEFKNSKDRMAGKKYLQNRREYEPFYDPSEEINDILKNCKPEKFEKDYVQGMYIKKYSAEALSGKKIETCLDGGMSDKARRQLQINAAVTYKNQPEALANMYIPHLQSVRQGLTEQKAAIDGILINKSNLKNIKKEDLEKIGLKDVSEITPEFLQRLEEMKMNIQKRTDNINQSIYKLNNKDYSPISGDNFEQVASSVYMRDYMKNIGEGYSYSFESNTMKPDASQMMIYQQNQMNARQEDNQAHDREMAQLDLENDLKLKQFEYNLKYGNVSGMDPNQLGNYRNMNSFGGKWDAVSSTEDYDEITKIREDIVKERVETNQTFYKMIGLPQEYYPKDGKTWSKEAQAFVDNYRISAANDPAKTEILYRYDKRMSELILKEKIYSEIQNMANEKTKPLEVKFKNDVITSAPSIINIQGRAVEITGNDLYNAVINGTGPLKVKMGSPGTMISGGSGNVPVNVTGYSQNRYFWNGVEITGKDAFEINKRVLEVIGKNSQTISDIKNQRNKVIKEEYAQQNESYTLPQLDDKDNPTKTWIATKGAGLPEKYKDKIVIQDTDGRGHLMIRVMPKGKNEDDYDPEQVFNSLLKFNAVDNKRVDENGKPDANGEFVIIGGINQLNVLPLKGGIQDNITNYIRLMEKGAANNQVKSSPYMRGLKSNYRLEVMKDFDGGFLYRVFDEKNPDSPIIIENNRSRAVSQFNWLLGDQKQ